ncbi:MAG TPA: Holliday junction resolvase RuvX [Acidimicrobiales bacterium]|nr:Holliday junction resolvase RuvX [Acidimicrobiales bacterium]
MARVLGLDPGTKRCGVAISDSARTMAFPREALTVDETLVAAIERAVNEESVELVVVGRPLSLAGAPTASTALADELFASLATALSPREVIQFDERLTTVEASRSLAGAGHRAREQRARIDSAAAVVMLQSFLEGKRA